MKKKFLYISLFSLSVSVATLFVKNRCIYLGSPMHSSCFDTFGFPIPVIVDHFSFYESIDGLVGQLFLFLGNVVIYFLIFSAIYLGYSKLTKKSKKK